ncbi:MAG TPA: hypothetical protein VK279_05670 [Solirubrobacteraceae bacterium]|nr:hypothetical protein [Solirubrobacteraceae bacterium]
MRRRQDGQATVEYSALLGLLALLLVVGSVTLGGAGLGPALVQAIRRALCELGVGSCPQGSVEPCVIARGSLSDAGSVSFGLVRLGADAAVVRERRSDGTVAVILLEGASAGAGVAAGAGVELGGAHLGREASGAALARAGRARTWILPDGRSADRLVHGLRSGASPILDASAEIVRRVAGAGPRVPAPRTTSFELRGGVEGEAEGALRGLGAAGRAVAGVADRLTVDHRTGRRTLRLGFDTRLDGAVSRGDAGLTLEGADVHSLGVTLDRHGRPVSAVASVALEGAAQGDLPEPARELARGAGVALDEAGRLEIDAHLDLTDPANRAAVEGLVRALGDPARPDRQLQAARIMGSRLASAALDLRVYGTDSARSGAGGRVSLGPGLGGGAHRTTSLATLLGAWSRPAAGAWSARLDCAR